jgi:hypothetical protein
MEPLTIVVSFDVGCGIAWIASLVHEFSVQRPKQLSIGALSHQFPSRLMDWIIPAAPRSANPQFRVLRKCDGTPLPDV